MTTTPTLSTAEARQLTDRIKESFAEIASLQMQLPATPRTQRRSDDRPVYFIQAENGLIKIGVSESPHGRLQALQTGSPVRLRLVGMIAGAGASGEAELHAKFAEYREHGEWFRPSADLLRFIKEQA
jgi:hypothetical protein